MLFKILTSRFAVLLLLVGLLLLRFQDPFLVQIARMKSFDYYQVNSTQTVSEKINIIEINDSDLELNGRWPWPREKFVTLIKKLESMGAKVIVMPILFAEPDKDDDVFAESLTNVVIAQTPSNKSNQNEGTPRGIAVVGGDATSWLETYLGMVNPVPILQKYAAGVGILTGTPELDGVVRRVPLVVTVDGELYPALSLETIRVIAGDESYQMKTTPGGIDSVRVPAVGKIKTDQNGRIWINFNQKNKTVSYEDFISGQVDNLGVNEIVVVTVSASGLATNVATPLGLMNVGDLQSNIINTMVKGDYITRPLESDFYELVTFLAIGLALIILVPFIKYYYTIPVYAGTIIGLIGYGYYSFAGGILFDISFAIFGITMIYFYLVFNNFAREYRLKMQIKKQFEHYLSPDLIKKMQKNPDMLKLGGERKELTVLFSDLRGFTTLSEGYKGNPQGLVAIINRYLTPMTKLIIDRKGTVDKYIGDAIMAFWNAPLDNIDHRGEAVKTAIGMFTQLELLNDKLKKEGFDHDLEIGVGVNTGSVVVGNMGSDIRFDYTCLGDAVNLASRLEGQSKNYHVGIIVGEETAKEPIDGVTFILLDKIAVKGKKEGIKIYTAILSNEKHVQQLKDHDMFIAAYFRQDWKEAKKFAVLGTMHWDKKLKEYYNMMIDRIKYLEKNPPGTRWDGVYIATSK